MCSITIIFHKKVLAWLGPERMSSWSGLAWPEYAVAEKG